MVLGVGWKDKFVKYSLITKIVGIKEIKYKKNIKIELYLIVV